MFARAEKESSQQKRTLCAHQSGLQQLQSHLQKSSLMTERQKAQLWMQRPQRQALQGTQTLARLALQRPGWLPAQSLHPIFTQLSDVAPWPFASLGAHCEVLCKHIT